MKHKIDMNDLPSMSLKEVFHIFSKYWNSSYRIWNKTLDDINFNIIVSINDFIHFIQIDKFINMNKLKAQQKTNYLTIKINNEQFTWESIEKSLININQHKYFILKKNSLIKLAMQLKTNKLIFEQVILNPQIKFINIKPDIIFITYTAHGCCIFLCQKIMCKNDCQKNIENINYFHPRSIMFFYENDKKYQEIDQHQKVRLEISKLVQKKCGNK